MERLYEGGAAMIETLFWILVLVIVYTYIGYGGLLWLLAGLRRDHGPKDRRYTPRVSVIVAAYNEEDNIARKLDNLLALDYPADRIEIIVASDASTDRTDAIVQSWAPRGVRLLRVEGRQGKTAVQNASVRAARGEVLVFTDATTVLERSSLRELVANFSDPQVGCVGARLVYTNDRDTQVGSGGTAYWGYETRIKAWESCINSLIGVSGCFYAVRASIYTPMEPMLISDFVVALDTVKKGYRVRFEPQAVCYEQTLDDAGKEIAMRVRVAVRTYNALWARRELLNPLRYGFFAFQLWSHKVLRYSVGLLGLGAFACNALLLGSPIYTLTMILQLAFYAAALVGFVEYRSKGKRGLMGAPYYLVMVNYAAMVALARFLRGEMVITWTPYR